MTHKTVAFERGTSDYRGMVKGYAAECETCGAVTFGGFATKAAAIDALEHTEETK